MIGPLACLLVLMAEPAAPSAVPDELLKKLADSDARLMRLYQEGAVTMTSRVEELDGEGKAQHLQEVVLRLAQKDGKPHGEVLKATRDGQDVTADERAKQAEQQARAEEDPKPRSGERPRGKKGQLSTPFGAEQQPLYAFRLLAPDPRHPDLTRVGFEPRGKPSQEVWIGEALVDPATGELKWLKQRPSSLPMFVDRMEMAVEFGAATPAGSAASRLTFEGHGGLPLFKKNFRATTTFSDYAVPK